MANANKFLKGQFLLDSGQLAGSFFQRTVVLICQHDAEGAFGLVLNRATDKKVGDVLVADLPAPLKDAPLYLGGPVQPAAMSFLHSDSFIPDANVVGYPGQFMLEDWQTRFVPQYPCIPVPHRCSVGWCGGHGSSSRSSL